MYIIYAKKPRNSAKNNEKAITYYNGKYITYSLENWKKINKQNADEIKEGGSYTYDGDKPVRNKDVAYGKYNFVGWTGTDLGSLATTVTIVTGSTGNREYTATWEANKDTKYRRNLIRKEILPIFEKINPSYISNIENLITSSLLAVNLNIVSPQSL